MTTFAFTPLNSPVFAGAPGTVVAAATDWNHFGSACPHAARVSASEEGEGARHRPRCLSDACVHRSARRRGGQRAPCRCGVLVGGGVHPLATLAATPLAHPSLPALHSHASRPSRRLPTLFLPPPRRSGSTDASQLDDAVVRVVLCHARFAAARRRAC